MCRKCDEPYRVHKSTSYGLAGDGTAIMELCLTCYDRLSPIEVLAVYWSTRKGTKREKFWHQITRAVMMK